jgi:GNAT superfamily N-acetyltransferase
VTARDHRQKGLARALIAQAKKLAHRRGYAALTARTRDINTATQTLLENHGFIEAEGNPDPDQTWRYYIWKTE